MTAIIFTVGMRIGRLAALMAFGNNILCDPLPQPVVKNKILTDEFTFQSFLLCLAGIIDDPTFQVKYILNPW